MPEPPLTDREIRILRGMIDDRESSLYIDAWFASRWKMAGALLGATGAVAVIIAAILQLVKGG